MADPALELAAEVGAAARKPQALRTLLLDLDGTLAPIAPTPHQARVPERTLELLERLRDAGWRIAVVSGRPAAEVERLVPLRGVHVFGSHGAEGSDGTLGDGSTFEPRLDELAIRAARLAATVPGALVEIKPAGIAFHDRAVASRNLATWRSRVRALLDQTDLEGFDVIPGRRVLEIRPRGFHKGIVLERLLGPRTPRERDASLVAIGDDVTDEDLFRALGQCGLAVRVGRSARDTLALRSLPTVAAVQRFLQGLVEHAERGRSSGQSEGAP